MANIAQILAAAFDNHNAGRDAEAERLCRQTLALAPRQPDALHLLGTLAFRTGRHAEAVTLIKKAIAQNGNYAEYHNSLALALDALGKTQQAIESLRRAAALDPGYAGAYYNLGNIFHRRREYARAEGSFRKAIALRPTLGLAHNNLGLVFKDQDDRDAAIACFRAAIAAEPGLAIAHYNLGVMLSAKDRYGEAIACYRRAIELQPAMTEFHNNLGDALMIQGALDEAERSFRRAMALDPKYAIAHSNLLMAMCYRGDAPETLLAEHKAWAAAHGAPREKVEAHFDNAPNPERRLRVGYVSPDFRGHSVSCFFEPLLASHDRAQVEVFCYSNVQRPDNVSARLEAMADRWRVIKDVDDATAAARIRDEQIDILVDLAGHTAHNRLKLFALKPAPVQLTWLGYPATTGLETMDYRITDAIADPPGATERFHTETLLRLQRCFLCYKAPQDAPPSGPPRSRANGNITFGSFNNLTKVSPEAVAVWSRILGALHGSRLLLKSKQAGDPATAARYRALFAAHGIGAERIELAAWTPSTHGHLSLYHGVDAALDPFPYNGTTTTCEALWMGVPTVVLRGSLHAGRVGASLLTAVGLDDLIADTPERYATCAIELASNPARIAALRVGLRDRMAASPLCDAAAFARAIENAYRAAWRRWCAA